MKRVQWLQSTLEFREKTSHPIPPHLNLPIVSLALPLQSMQARHSALQEAKLDSWETPWVPGSESTHRSVAPSALPHKAWYHSCPWHVGLWDPDMRQRVRQWLSGSADQYVLGRVLTDHVFCLGHSGPPAAAIGSGRPCLSCVLQASPALSSSQQLCYLHLFLTCIFPHRLTKGVS